MWQRLKSSTEKRSTDPASLSWVIPGQLALGKFPRSTLPLAAANIQGILSLLPESEGTLPDDFHQRFLCDRYPLPDSRTAEELTPDRLAAAVELIRHRLQNHQSLYVHCLAGIERSPAVCIAYLCQYDAQNLWDALQWVKTVHPPTRLTTAQLRTIEKFLQSSRQ